MAIGIEDNGEITGFSVDRAQNVEGFERAALTFCSPVPNVRKERLPVMTASGRDDFILVLDVEASTDRAISRRGDRKVFLRQQDRSVELDREQVTALESASSVLTATRWEPGAGSTS